MQVMSDNKKRFTAVFRKTPCSDIWKFIFFWFANCGCAELCCNTIMRSPIKQRWIFYSYTFSTVEVDAEVEEWRETTLEIIEVIFIKNVVGSFLLKIFRTTLKTKLLVKYSSCRFILYFLAKEIGKRSYLLQLCNCIWKLDDLPTLKKLLEHVEKLY